MNKQSIAARIKAGAACRPVGSPMLGRLAPTFASRSVSRQRSWASRHRPELAANHTGMQAMKIEPKRFVFVAASLIVAGGLVTSFAVSAQDAPLSYKASPDVYKLLAENDQFRVILQTSKPGQRDQWHSHSALAGYRLTD